MLVDARAINASIASEFRSSIVRCHFKISSFFHSFLFWRKKKVFLRVCMRMRMPICVYMCASIIGTLCAHTVFQEWSVYLFIWFSFSNCTFISHELKWARYSFYRLYSFCRCRHLHRASYWVFFEHVLNTWDDVFDSFFLFASLKQIATFYVYVLF